MRDEDAYKPGTVVRIKKTGLFALIVEIGYQHEGRGFLHYLAKIDGKGEALYAVYHHDIELECLPSNRDEGEGG